MNTKRRLLRIVLLITAGAAVHASVAADQTPCVTAPVAAPILLPDGSAHEAGTLTVCDVRSLSPVASFHRISIDGRPVGMFVSRRGNSEVAADAAPTIHFEVNASGALALVGYVVPSRRSTAFRLANPAVAVARRGTVAGAVVALAATAR